MYRKSWNPDDAFDWQLIQQHIIDGRNLLIRFNANDQMKEASVARSVKSCIKQAQMRRYYFIDADEQISKAKRANGLTSR